MFRMDDFRTGQFGVPLSCLDELPEMCRTCLYLITEEYPVCFCDAPFYYYCAYTWPDKITQTTPPCFQETP